MASAAGRMGIYNFPFSSKGAVLRLISVPLSVYKVFPAEKLTEPSAPVASVVDDGPFYNWSDVLEALGIPKKTSIFYWDAPDKK